jgi:hypothetical protein
VVKNEILKLAAKEFAEKSAKLSTVLEIAIVGSTAGNDPYPNDLDLAIVVRNLDELPIIAKYSRQISKYYHAWDVFLFDDTISFIGRICFRKECPGRSMDCYVPDCGEPPYLRVIRGFKYNERTFFKSPIEVLTTTFDRSQLLARQDELGIKMPRKYMVLNDIRIKCVLCGETFVFTGEEQKLYKKRGLVQPKRCPECLFQLKVAGLRDW